MENLRTVLQEHSLRATPQRVAVYEAILQLEAHASVEAIYKKVRAKISSISLATVYAIVRSFCNAGIIAEVSIDNGKFAYEHRTDKHHHFMCTMCGKVYDLNIPLCKAAECGSVGGHVVHDFHGYFYGICKQCKNKKLTR